MKRLVLAAAALLLAAGPAPFDPCAGAAFAQSRCCKMCSAGKACGDSCISRDKTCHKGKGCACNG
ncbi:MAG TPA: hypothetical protein VEZ70_10560 [Allosphingosinicella sp.]|nr:hypothetical protein [Allosphingosinicella sp.]